MPTSETIIDALQARFDSLEVSEFRGQTRVIAPRGSVWEVLRFLRQECGFDMLVDVTCVDYLHARGASDRFGLVYLLASVEANERITIRTMLNEPDLTVKSVYSLWKGADWLEREVYDMFGIEFEGHPNMRRILLPEEFTAFPLRKDYPLRGRGERHNFKPLTRDEG